MQNPALRRHIHRLRLDQFSLVKDTLQLDYKRKKQPEIREGDTEHLSKDQGDANIGFMQLIKTL